VKRKKKEGEGLGVRGRFIVREKVKRKREGGRVEREKVKRKKKEGKEKEKR
jgi:hypothetical protein